MTKEEKCEKDCNCKETCDCGCQDGNDCTCGDDCNCHDNEKTSCKGKKKEKIFKNKNDDKALLEEIEKLKSTNADLLEKIKYSQAELINYRRRKDEETENLLKYANKDIIVDLIPIVDNFERAIKLDDNVLTDELSKFLSGFKMMHSQMSDVLKTYGVSEINRVGEEFNPNLEQALMMDSVTDKKDDEVLEVMLKGYKLKDRVIRPATVKINKINK